MAAKEEQNSYSEPEWSKSFRDGQDAPYWLANIDDKITPENRKVLQEYSQIPEQDIRRHVYETRNKLWAIRSYPCTGLGVWLTPELPMCPQYDNILSRLKKGARLIDVGAFMGYDLRRLAFDGAPTDNLFAIDIVSHWDVGFEFFRDRGRFNVKLIESDILHPTTELKELTGTVDIINIAHVIHQWPRRTQIECVKQLAALTKPGAMIVGYQAGNINPRPLESHAGVDMGKLEDRPEVHDEESWKRLWQDAGNEIGITFETHAKLLRWEETGRNPKDTAYLGPDMRMLQFVVTRID